jgi:DNA replication and repair protein RecF
VQSQPADLFASEGQQRTMAIALKLGQARVLQAEWRQPPLLLVDDIFGELDRDRRNRFFVSLPAESQRVITATSISWLAGAPIGKLYEIIEDKQLGRALRLLG